MGGFKFKGRSSTFLFLIMVMSIVFFMQDLEGASALTNNQSISCNGTIGDCIFGHEDETGEFLKYSVGGRWLLQAKDPISYNALQQGQICPAAQYSDCIVSMKNVDRCALYNRCKRSA